MIKVSGEVTLKVRYAINLDMSEAEFESLSEKKQNELIDEAIDWQDATRSAEVDEIDVWDIEEK